MIYHRIYNPRTQSDELLRLQLETGKICGRPKTNYHASDLASVKAWRGPLPSDCSGGIEFSTDIEPHLGGNGVLENWYLNPPHVTQCDGDANCVCMSVTILRYKFYQQPTVEVTP